MEDSELHFFECSICAKILWSRRGIIQHLKSCQLKARTESKKVYKCPSCPRKFANNSGLWYHVRSNLHAAKECSQCHEVFRSDVLLARHTRTHTADEEHKIKCFFCEQRFITHKQRLWHCRKVHPSDLNERKVKQSCKKEFNCFFCKKMFTKKSYRLQHESWCNYRHSQQINPSPVNSASSSNCPPHSVIENVELLEHGAPNTWNNPSSLADLLSVSSHRCSSENQLCSSVENVELLRPCSTDTHNNVLLPADLLSVSSHRCSSENQLCSSAENVELSQSSSPDTQKNISLSGDSMNITPSLARYLRDRKPFMQLSPDDMRSPRRAILNLSLGQETVGKYRQKVNLLQQKVRRLEEKVETMQDLIKHLAKRNDISCSLADDLLSDLPNPFLQMTLRSCCSQKAKYGSELRTFALTLHFYSPRAYRYVREVCGNLLPSESVIRNWYCQINGKPGFFQESMDALRLKVKNCSCNEKVICNLIMDEIDIRKELTYRDGVYHGYVETGLGNPSDSDNQPLAKKALVFMLVCLNGNWKIPIAYFLIDSISAKELSKLVTQALLLVDGCGVVCRSITFDGARTNLTCCKELGANLEFGAGFQPWFTHPRHPEEKVYLLFDPPHALKLCRNTLGDFSITDVQGRRIDFKDFEMLFCSMEEKGPSALASAPKLTKRHIRWRENKMRVRLAAQLLSTSVYAALMLAKEKKVQGLEHCEGTALFCKHMDEIFDLLNCRTRFSRKKSHDVPIQDESIDKTDSWCRTAEEYLSSLTINETPIMQHPRKTGFLGFIMTLRNIIPLFQTLKNYGLRYLLTYKLNQDHLETWFSAVRSKGGCNNNPNCEQFKAIFKKLLIHHELRTTAGSNCESSSSIKILEVSSSSPSDGRSAQLVTEQLTDELLNCEEITDAVCEEYLEEAILDKVDDANIAYVAGFIQRKLQEKKRKLLKRIEISSGNTDFDLIKYKNRGGLTLPADIIVNYCREIEKRLRSEESERKLLCPQRVNSFQNEVLLDIEDSEVELPEPVLRDLIIKIYFKMKIRFLCKKISEVDRNIRHSSMKRVLFAHH